MAAISDLNLAIPSVGSAGDTLGVVVYSDQAITAPAGWTEFQAGFQGGVHYSASSHVVTSGEISSNTTWNWLFASPTSHVGYDLFDFANVTSLDTSSVTPFASAVTSMGAPSLTVTRNEIVLAFWIALNETPIRMPFMTSGVAGTYANGGLSHAAMIYTGTSNGPTGVLTAGVDVPSTGIAAQASLTGAGSHLVTMQSGAIL